MRLAKTLRITACLPIAPAFPVDYSDDMLQFILRGLARFGTIWHD